MTNSNLSDADIQRLADELEGRLSAPQPSPDDNPEEAAELLAESAATVSDLHKSTRQNLSLSDTLIDRYGIDPSEYVDHPGDSAQALRDDLRAARSEQRG
jgi:hypothetical protein